MAVGIDMGLESFATLSTDEKIDNPRFFRTDEKALAKVQRKLSKMEKGTTERRKVKKVVSRIHERIANRRHNFIHQEARRIINRFGIIAVEALNMRGMLANHCLAKSIADASWGQFIDILSAKAEEAGREFITVNPNGTSQICSRCHSVVPKDLSVRIHSCPVCGLALDRDLNASYNILALGLQSLGKIPRSPCL
jgi:putative transposase